MYRKIALRVLATKLLTGLLLVPPKAGESSIDITKLACLKKISGFIPYIKISKNSSVAVIDQYRGLPNIYVRKGKKKTEGYELLETGKL